MIKVGSLSMRTKILVLCLACTLLALALQTWFFLASASSMIFRLEQEASQKAQGRMQDDLYSWIKGYENALISIYNQTDLMQALASGAEAGKGRNSPTAYRMMQTAFVPDQYVNALYLYGMDRRLISYSRIASTPRFSFPEDIFQDPASRAEAVSDYVASDNRVMLVTSFYSASRQKTILRLVLKLYSNNVKTKIGFLVCDIDPKGISRIVEKYAYSDRQLVWLQPPGDDPILVYGDRKTAVGTEYERVSGAIKTRRWKNPDRLRVGNNVFLATPQQKYALTAFTLVPQELLEESQNLLLRNLLLTALLLVLVALVSVTLVSRSLTTPLTGMMARLGQIQDGQTALRLEVGRRDEIGVLGQSINEMLDRIQELIAAEYDVELQLKHAEYKALQAQVNPHFLYNTLDTMGGIAMSQNVPLVASLCRAMSHLFRYSLDMKDPLATLGDELTHLKHYLHVMNVRTGNTLTVDIDVAESLLEVKVPRLSLQPLVENSISHGLKNKRGKKVIRIGAEQTPQGVPISVDDNGVGMDARTINDQLDATPLGVTEKNASIGIGNIHARIVLFFGKGYGVRLESSGEGTRVQVTVPGAAV